ncbi:MAG TPA: GGDEF domain-containing protein [Rubrivivax sp.]|nr:GGDEF domain-containing protein [Rubrivivax sp.]
MTHTQLLIAVILLQQLLFGAVWLGAARLRIARRAAGHWEWASWLTAGSMLLIMFRGQASIWWTVVAANVLLIAALVILRRGIQVFARSRPSDTEHGLLLGGSGVGLALCAALDSSMLVVMMLVSVTLAWTLLSAAGEVRRQLAAEFGARAALICSLPLTVIGGLFALRTLAGPLAGEALAPSISTADIGNTGLLLATMFFGLILNGTLVAMVFGRIVGRLRYQSDHDALTGLLSRRPLERLLQIEGERHGRTGHPYALLSIDIDHFKQINDRHGHAVGDRVLARVAQTLRACSREGDSVARMGGEEFCTLLPGADEAGARQIAQRLLQAVRELQHPELGGALRVTVSIGLAVARTDAEPVAGLMLRVDRALYAAKLAGRDRVVEAGPDRQPVAA